MRMKSIACLAFLLNAILFATYYAVAKEALGRIDPIVFSFCEMLSLAPVALCVLIFSRHTLTKAVVRRGVLLGSCLCLALFTISIALKYTTATSTAFFPSMNGFLAAFIAWLWLRQPIGKATWFAGLLSVVGTVLLVANTEIGGPRGSLIAFLGGLFFTGYVFLSDHEQQEETAPWALFGVELLTMALWASLVVLLFGDWENVRPLSKDIWVVLYVAGACTFLPTMLTVLLQKYISPVTVSFIYILEPVLGAVVSYLYLHEQLPLYGYLGGALVVVGAFVHTWETALRSQDEQASGLLVWQRLRLSSLGSLVTPVLILGAGGLLLYRLSGLPSPLWSQLYHFGTLFPTFDRQGLGPVALLLIIRALCWLVAWIALIAMAALAAYRAWRKLLAEPLLSWPRHEEVVLDVRMLRQQGIKPYTSSIRKGRREDKPLIQRRRQERLARLELVE